MKTLTSERFCVTQELLFQSTKPRSVPYYLPRRTGSFSLLGTTYGGDGRVNFALPNLQGRTPMHMGNGHILGEVGGEQAHTLTIAELPTHVHTAMAGTDNGTAIIPTGNYLAGSSPQLYRQPDQNLTPLRAGTIANVGGSQAHLNMQPFLALTFCIALQGIFPSRN